MKSLYGITVAANELGQLHVIESELEIASENTNFIYLRQYDQLHFYTVGEPFHYSNMIKKEELNNLLISSKKLCFSVNMIGYSKDKAKIYNKVIRAVLDEIEKRTILVEAWTEQLTQQWEEVE